MKAVSIALVSGIIGCLFVQPVSAAGGVEFKEKIVYSFQGYPADGAIPYAGLIDVNGMLYGTTLEGGTGYNCDTAGCGTVYSLDPHTGAEKVLYSFCSPGYCTNGYRPLAGVIDVKGTLYGTTYDGGSGIDGIAGGTVFALDLDTGAETVVYSFCQKFYKASCPDGSEPAAGVIDVKGLLYGTTEYGGTNNINGNTFGTVFALDPATGIETVVYSFCGHQNCTDGMYPESSLIDVNGTLYGTTYEGGTHGDGTVFSLDPTTGAEKVLYSFAGKPDGENPAAGVIAVNGMLYGTTVNGGVSCDAGAYGCGTVFSLDPDNGAEKALHAFCSRKNCKDGATPYAGLVEMDGVLYGTTFYGGASVCHSPGCGTVFSVDPASGVESVIHAFCSRQQTCTDGASPYAGLVDLNGTMYGTTEGGGGAMSYGTVFALKQKR